ncbi:MAG: electron transfer flavoprotein subunit alpha/FixB family protein [Melioribacteraceae bacterium]|jgi:electron transfer flavoprotein alpha subunit|nr:electron transfer flavoprotein subunit alpha/FixB family protein [Melioribacteraceae bacterium]
MANKFIIFVEQRDGEIKKSSLEVLKKGGLLAVAMRADIEAVTIGNEISNLENTGRYGVSKITHLKNTELANYSVSAYTDLLVSFADESNANFFLFANTAMGKDLAPVLSVKLNSGIVVDCVELEETEGNLVATKPVYAGKALTIVKSNSEKNILTLRPNVFTIGEVSDAKAEVIVKDVEALNLSNKVISVSKAGGKLDVTEADIIVSGGRGLKAPENFGMIEELASLLGAANGASRAAVDAGWRPHSEQVGQTGKTVSPNLYIAVGISGAIQHLAGMQSSKYIVAINKDKDAPIFGVADYGIAGDAFEVIPALIEELKKN